MTWADDVRRANETLDWIEQRQGPLPEAGYARIQTTVGQVRAMAEGQDDARIIEIRELLAEVNTPVGYFPDLNEALDWAFALAGRIDALTAERDVLRVERDIARRVEQESSAAADAWQAEAVKVRGERDALAARLAALLHLLDEFFHGEESPAFLERSGGRVCIDCGVTAREDVSDIDHENGCTVGAMYAALAGSREQAV